MTMNFTCQDRDRILEDGTPAEWAELEAHGANCAVCANELRACRRSCRQGTTSRTMGLALAWIQPLARVANCRGCCSGAGLDSFCGLGLFAPHAAGGAW